MILPDVPAIRVSVALLVGVAFAWKAYLDIKYVSSGNSKIINLKIIQLVCSITASILGILLFSNNMVFKEYSWLSWTAEGALVVSLLAIGLIEDLFIKWKRNGE